MDRFYLEIVLTASFQAGGKDFFFVKYLLAYASEASLSCLVPNVCRYFSWLVEIQLLHTALKKHSSVSFNLS